MWKDAIQFNIGNEWHLRERLLKCKGVMNVSSTRAPGMPILFDKIHVSMGRDVDKYINHSDYVLFTDDNDFMSVNYDEFIYKYAKFFDENNKFIGGSEMNGFGGMFENMFGGALGYTGEGMIRLGLNGEMAVKTGSNSSPVYKTYNVKTGRLTNVTNFCFDIGHDFFFVMPTTKVVQGDILIVDGHPKCVIENNDNKTIKVMDYENSAIQEIVPERHVFMGKTYFYRKVVSMFGSTGFFKAGKGPENMLKFAMKAKMFEVLAGKSSGSDNGFGNLMPMMLMGNMFGGGKGDDTFGDFANMFDFELADAPDDDEEESEESIEELEARLAALKAKKESSK